MRLVLITSFFILLSSFCFGQTGLLPEDLYESLKNQEDMIILDIRSDEQYSEAEKILESIHIPFEKLATELKARGLAYSKNIIVYDRTGNVGRIAVSFLKKMLYTNVHYVMGGYLAWKDNLARIKSGIPENEPIPYATSNAVVLDSLYQETSADSLVEMEEDAGLYDTD
ncbi:MAG: rhodanese-like domain-containing protein [Calditrichia bacterium]|nr:rhodanese-like domain-containing protein [Calditrichia bacterium]